MEKQLAVALMQITKILSNIEAELKTISRISKKETDQRISESRTRERQIRQQIMLTEAQRKRA